MAKLCDFGTAVQLRLPVYLSPKERTKILSSRAQSSEANNSFRSTERSPPHSSARLVMEVEEEFIDINENLGVVGTLGYTAPEVLAQQPYSYPVDVFSFAVVAWEIFADTVDANPLKNPECIVDRIYLGERPPWQDSHPNQLRELIGSCWMSLPSLRPTMSEVANNLLASPETIPSKQKEDIHQFRFKVRY